MKDLLKRIGITQAGYFTEDGNFVIDFDDSDQFNKAFSRLEKSDLVEENEDSSVINLNVSNVMYIGEGYSFNLIADFDEDSYKMVVTELDDDDKSTKDNEKEEDE